MNAPVSEALRQREFTPWPEELAARYRAEGCGAASHSAGCCATPRPGTAIVQR